MAICSGDCQDQRCRLVEECERVYKGSHPPCSDIVETAPSASDNKRVMQLPTYEEVLMECGVPLYAELISENCMYRKVYNIMSRQLHNT
jgi:hypothetical protein